MGDTVAPRAVEHDLEYKDDGYGVINDAKGCRMDGEGSITHYESKRKC